MPVDERASGFNQNKTIREIVKQQKGVALPTEISSWIFILFSHFFNFIIFFIFFRASRQSALEGSEVYASSDAESTDGPGHAQQQAFRLPRKRGVINRFLSNFQIAKSYLHQCDFEKPCDIY